MSNHAQFRSSNVLNGTLTLRAAALLGLRLRLSRELPVARPRLSAGRALTSSCLSL